MFGVNEGKRYDCRTKNIFYWQEIGEFYDGIFRLY